MPEKLEVLVLDDEPIVGKRLKPALSKIGCEVEVFEEPKAALARIEQKEFDIVVTDIRMDEIDGMEVLEFVAERWPRTKVVMITGYATVRSAVAAMQEGAYDYLTKPFSIRELVARAKALLRRMEAWADTGETEDDSSPLAIGERRLQDGEEQQKCFFHGSEVLNMHL